MLGGRILCWGNFLTFRPEIFLFSACSLDFFILRIPLETVGQTQESHYTLAEESWSSPKDWKNLSSRAHFESQLVFGPVDDSFEAWGKVGAATGRLPLPLSDFPAPPQD